MTKKFKKNLFVLFLVLSFFVVNHILYLSKNEVYISGDQHQYVGIAVDYVRIYSSPSLSMIGQLLDASIHRPPMYPFLISLSFSIFGLSDPTFYGAIVNAIFLVILGISIYEISNYFFRNNLISITSVVVGMSYPLQVILSRQVMTELPLTALTALTMMFLLKSESLEKKKYVLLASIVFGISLLTRFTAGFFVVLPVMYVVLIYIKNHGLKVLVREYWISIVIALAPSLLFYLHNLAPFMKYVFANTTHGPSWSPHNKFSLESALWYPVDLGEVLSLVLWVLLIIGFIFGLRTFRKLILLYLWVLSAYLIFTFVVPFKSDRFIMPIYPALAVLTVVPLSYIRSKFFLWVSCVCVIGIALSVYVYTTWNIGPFTELQRNRQVSFFKKPVRLSLLPYERSPNSYIYKAETILQTLEEDMGLEENDNPSILFTISIEGINKIVYQYMNYQTLNDWRYIPLVGESFEYYREKLGVADYVIAKDGEAIDDHHPVDRIENIPTYNNDFLQKVTITNEFKLIAKEKYTDGEYIYLFKRAGKKTEL